MGPEAKSGQEKSGQDPETWKAPETGKPAVKDEFFIGTTENPDGTIDYSKAATMKVSPEEAAATRKDTQQRTEKKRREAFEIPSGVKGGSTDMVRYELKKRIFISEEALAKARAGGNNEQVRRRFSQLQTLQRAQQILSKEVERYGSLPAKDGSEILDGHIAFLEADKNPETVKDDIIAARELDRLLNEEALKVQNK